MILTYKGLRDEVLRLLDETATENPTTLQLVKDFINQAHQQRCTEFQWSFMLWPSACTIAIVPGQREYALHQEFHRPLYMWNRATKEYCREVPFRAIPQGGYDWNNDTGASTHFCYWGSWPVQFQPPVPGVVSVISDNSVDSGGNYDIVVKGEDTNGVLRAERITPAGLSTASGLITFQKILGITKGSGWNGNATFSIGTTTIVTLLGCEMGRSYKTVYFMESGNAGEVIEYRFYRQPMFLVNDYDIPELPAPHAQLLVWDALVMMAGYLTETNPQTLNLWRSKQMEAQVSLYQAYGNEGQNLEAQPTYVRYMGDGGAHETFPRWGW